MPAVPWAALFSSQIAIFHYEFNFLTIYMAQINFYLFFLLVISQISYWAFFPTGIQLFIEHTLLD